ncbi:MAG: efflux RND transporter periplasmic adaptor subunit [Gammaproteobacteria bacterium]
MTLARTVFISPLLLMVFMISACDNPDSEPAMMPAEKPRFAKIVPLVSAGMSVLRSFPGTLEASNTADLAFRVGGQLRELPAQAGLRVKKGDLLARLDETEYQNSFKERQARYDLARIQHDQARKLLKQNLASQLQYDQTEAELKSAQAALDQARDNLQYTHLLAPFDGVVARVDMKNHQAIQAKLAFIRLQDVQRLDIRFSVPESLISQLKQVDDPAVIDALCGTVRFSAHPERPYRACHKEHESVPDSLTRNYSAVFTLEKITDFSTLPGMSASIELDFSDFMPENASKGLLVPVESVFDKDGKQWVWRVDLDMRARQVPVEVGHFEAGKIEIAKGLVISDRVIAAGVSYIREGMLVRPLTKERGL